mmetsp:Transcript_17558/g.21274  ORF Transcript_17558/g.21274 Transcript_17558/m.21274 type:complete len:407 (+) Transcript_17558:141-1361(+)|eukprot:CAMPEP_0204824494 /NCGR_PEP_ID=MMETSP1346-20131115/2499_1 /ASSEMBLY_ACC=CAM_ASM_000771 /TAXON_ID=215587 /ORGANISM="Aplanochytrium stocchinoi, Strain GSBS06" /LENGTH=406 /DNA_ID=CAMNT_0051951665 /DNA_START=74 /DNA_END=1294 /DNA_ORIENTATION=-
MTTYQSKFEPSLLLKLKIATVEQLYCLYLIIIKGLPFVLDVLKNRFLLSKEKQLPSSVASLLDHNLYSRISGRKVKKVEYSDRLEQHANSTDRAWFKVIYVNNGKEEESYVFAKTQAKTFFVRAIMCIFDVYRNELDTYANVKMPVLTPGVHVATWTPSRFVLAMDDLRKEKVEFPNLWEKHVDKALGKKVLSTLSKIHAKFWGNVPKGAWNDKTRPYKGKVMGLYTLYVVNKRCPGLIPDDVCKVFSQALWHWDTIRDFYSRSYPKTMCHGDTHIGNFYITKEGEVGTFDFQCKAEEHPMRDVTYFLSCSYPEENLERDEKELIRYYLSELEANGVPKSQIPSFENCWLQYRMQPFYTMYAFIFSGGFSDLMDPHQTNCGVKRIVAHFQRVDSAGAFYDLLEGKS